MTSLPINISSGFTILVKVGDSVSTGDILAKKEVIADVEINLAEAFSVNPKKVKKYLKKNPGDSIEEGETIASKSKLFGMKEEKIISHIRGTISKYDRNSGKLSVILQVKDEEAGGNFQEIVCPIDGTIELCDNGSSEPIRAGQILIRTDKNVLVGVLGTGEIVEAEIYLLEEDERKPEDVVVQLHHLDTKIIDKILLGGVFDRDVLIKAIGMGVKGVVGVVIRDVDIEYINSRSLGAPIVVIESKDLPQLIKWNGKKVFMNGNGKTILLLKK